MKYLIITADTNDADYVTSITKITDVQLKKIKPIIKAIKANDRGGYNWPTEDYHGGETTTELYVDSGLCTQEAHDIFQDLVPKGDNTGAHTIDAIRVLEVTKETKLL